MKSRSLSRQRKENRQAAVVVPEAIAASIYRIVWREDDEAESKNMAGTLLRPYRRQVIGSVQGLAAET